ncbi:uncharacterized protein LOC129801446 isoform X3 [Phlebotomus papatasi]|uniref:uncharacterized protein LOC129801446 isoform X3 n=1 Tax=Phlebotomus papatasi TaxID=29031 RepID=UPI002484047D|nr:uncharacterized protein LOC129801446 isoform X3 [Phlebotomus papatasi]
MSSRFRSASVGASPRVKPVTISRADSAQATVPEVRCACQFFQSDSLLPERINPVGSRPSSRTDYYTETISSRPSSRGGELIHSDQHSDLPHEPIQTANLGFEPMFKEFQAEEPIMPSPPSTLPITNDRDLFVGMKYGEAYTMSRSSSQDRPSSVRSSVDRFPSAGRIMKTVSFEVEKNQAGFRDTDQVVSQVKFQLHNRAALGLDRNYDIRDHEYEPIGQPVDESIRLDPDTEELEGAVGGQENVEVEPAKRPASETSSITSHERKLLRVPTEEEGADDEMSVHDIQKDIEERYFTSATPESRTDGELHTSAVDSSAIEDLPLDRGSRKKTMLSSAQDRGRQMQQKLRNQAGKLRSKLRSMKKTQNGSPKSKERKKFKAPEFTKLKNLHMPKVSKPEMPKFKRPEFTKIEFKRPEFTKITLPERPTMAKFRIPEKFSSLKLRRTRSMKESTASTGDSTSGTNEPPIVMKKKFDFATYPRIFDKMRKQKTDVTKSERPGTPPPPTFATVSKSVVVKQDSLVPEDGDSDVRRQYSLEDEEFQRESSLERRMRQHFSRQRQESEQEQSVDNEEQRQLAEFDKENREIHEISLARQEEFKQRLPLVHQDSDLVSEESAGKWTGSLNLNQSSSLQGSEKFEFDNNSIPIEAKEPRKGVIEQIDDDEFFLRSKGISQDNIQIGEYISSAIREGLTTPMNTLAQVGRYSPYYDEDVDLNSEPIDYGYDIPKKPRRVRDRDRSSLENEEYFGTYPPTKPIRKHRSYESDERIVPQTDAYYNESETRSFYDNDQIEGVDQPDMYIDDEDEPKSDMQERMPFPPTPPKAPKRRRKLHRPLPRDVSNYVDNLAGRSVSNNFIANGDTDENVIVYRTEHKYPVPLATPEHFTPIPTPRSRSRSQASRLTDDDRTSHGAESLISDTHVQIVDFLRTELDLTGNNGYAVVKKEPPPRPPPPIRRKKASKSPAENQFATMPLPKRSVSPPARPKRNYSTIAPSRPPRTKSVSSLGEELKLLTSPSPDATQYEEIEDLDSHKDLQSGEVIKKMKERPLPPPPRPERSLKRPKKYKKDDKPDDDRDGGGIMSDSRPLNIEEVEVSTQTDPLPDDFCCEELEITSDMKTITPSQCKTLEDILKEEQEAELERAQQLAAEQSLSRGLQRFRESNHRSLSERSRASTLDRPKTPGSRPISPNAVVVERKISTPTMLTEATLSVEPVDEPISSEIRPSQEHSREVLEEPRTEVEEEKLLKEILNEQPVEILAETESNIEATIPEPSQSLQEDRQENQEENEREKQEEITRRMQDEVEAELERCAQRLEQVIDVLQQDDVPPVPPPRRKSSAGESLIPQQTSGNLQLRDLSVDRLNVNQLQAGRLFVSELEGSSLSTQDLECKSGNLVVKSIELPKGIIEEIVDRVRSQMPAPSTVSAPQTTTHEDPELEKEPPARPPPPHGYYHLPSEFYPYSLPPASFYRLRDPSDEDEQPPTTSHRRRRHHRQHRDSSEDEDHGRESRTRSRHRSRSQDSIIDLGGQFLKACSSQAGRSVRQILQMVRATVVKEENRNEVNVVAMLLIVLMASLVLICMGGGDRTVHHHHWDFFNAPGNGNMPK